MKRSQRRKCQPLWRSSVRWVQYKGACVGRQVSKNLNSCIACSRVSQQSLPCTWTTAVAYALRRLPTTCTCVSCSASFSGKHTFISFFAVHDFFTCQRYVIFKMHLFRILLQHTSEMLSSFSFRYQPHNYSRILHYPLVYMTRRWS